MLKMGSTRRASGAGRNRRAQLLRRGRVSAYSRRSTEDCAGSWFWRVEGSRRIRRFRRMASGGERQLDAGHGTIVMKSEG